MFSLRTIGAVMLTVCDQHMFVFNLIPARDFQDTVHVVYYGHFLQINISPGVAKYLYLPYEVSIFNIFRISAYQFFCHLHR